MRCDMSETYFLYHSIGMYPGKARDLAGAMAEFAFVWGKPDDSGRETTSEGGAAHIPTDLGPLVPKTVLLSQRPAR